ncbi:MAG: hypothetical protein C5B50_30560 [Verrucomicrobia bacterium]|nr:MAG: hypothetical protein C5B50_30560 [Verrucomicrobiota bacterium]
MLTRPKVTEFAATDLVKLQRVPRDVARWQKAQQQVLRNLPGAALANYRELVQRFPGISQLWFELGIAASGNLEFAAAETAFGRAEELSPADANMLVLLGQQYHRLRLLERARACFERAVAANPTSIHAQLSLAAWCERERRLDRAWECVEACVKLQPGNPQALCVRALLLHRKDQNTEAEALLRDLIRRDSADPNVRHSSRHLLALVLDELGQYSEAFRWLCEAKTVLRNPSELTRMQRDYDEADSRRRELLKSLTPEILRRWRQEGPANHIDIQLALLGGHPRSGTTLLEQILGANPAVEAFDEPEAFAQEIWNTLAPMPPAPVLKLATLDGLSKETRIHLRNRYLRSLLRDKRGQGGLTRKVSGDSLNSREFGFQQGTNGNGTHPQLLLDKNPSPTTALYLWLRLFPELKVIIALRDPRDVVISCFFQNLALTPTNANFLSLERTVIHYANLMDVWLRMRELGEFDWIETRYEDLVEHVEVEGKRVTEFVGMPWHPDQAKHHEIARQKFLFAPTFNEVAKPLYNKSVGRWKNYAKELEPIQERLAPYCKAFGYAH